MAVNAQNTYHIGNSLTDTKNEGMEPMCRSAGKSSFGYYRSTVPGAPTDWLWDHYNECNGERDIFAGFSAHAPIAHLFTQPFSAHCRSVANETEYSGRFYDRCRQSSPNVQLWLYMQWPPQNWNDCWSDGSGLGVPAARSWIAGLANHNIYFDRLQKSLAARYPGTTIGVVPAGIALARLRIEIEARRVPGLTAFTALFEDDVHLSNHGAYIVCLVHYACIYKQTPLGNVTWKPVGVTDAQAEIFKQIAWDVARDYPTGGMNGPGTLTNQILSGDGVGVADRQIPTRTFRSSERARADAGASAGYDILGRAVSLATTQRTAVRVVGDSRNGGHSRTVTSGR